MGDIGHSTLTGSKLHDPKAHEASHEVGGGDEIDFDQLAEGTTYKKFLATEQTKLTSIEDAADVTDSTNVAAAGSIMDSDISSAEGFMRKTGSGAYTAVKSNIGAATTPTVNEDSGDGYGIGSQWIDTTADKAYVCLDATVAAAVWTEITQSGSVGDMEKSTYDPNNDGVIAVTQTEATKYPDTGEQAFLDGDHTKLNGIEALADVTDSTNVDSAGALMKTGGTMSGNINMGTTGEITNCSVLNLNDTTGGEITGVHDIWSASGITMMVKSFGGTLDFDCGSTSRLALRSSTNTFEPRVDNVMDLGTSTLKYKNVYAHTLYGSLAWSSITGEPAYTTRWPTWTEVTSKPSTFTPSAHNQSAATITSGTLAVAQGGTGVTGDTYDADKVDGCHAGTTKDDVWKIPTQDWQGTIYFYQSDSLPMVGLAPATAGYQLTTQGSSANPTWTAASDLIWSDTHCPVCGEEFKDNDELALQIRKHNEVGDILTIPVHIKCTDAYKTLEDRISKLEG